MDFDQLNFVNVITNGDDDDDGDDTKEETKEDTISMDKNDDEMGIYSLAMNDEEDFENLSKYLPYFTDFISRKEKSVLNQNDFKDDPSGYLKAIRNKYNIRHPRRFENHHDDDNNIDDDGHFILRPWIEGKMEKLMAQSGYFGNEKWKTRLFRLFDEALVWFDDDPSFFKKLFNRRSSKHKKNGSKISDKEEAEENNIDYMTPFGVLPLAMITGLKTCDIDKMDASLSEDELLRLELEIGDEGVIILKCSDFNQRIKWYECLHSAIFTVKRPLFTKDKDLWRITEPKVDDEKTNNTSTKLRRQLTKEDVQKHDEKRRKPMHIRMGQSLAFRLSDIRTSIGTPSKSNDDVVIELPDFDTTQSNENIDRVPSLNASSTSNSVKVL